MERMSDRIGSLMTKKGYTQKEFARLVGVTESAMSRYLNNSREPKLEVVGRMALALNTTTDYLVNGNQSFSEFEEVYNLVARSVNNMSDSEKNKLMRILVGGEGL